MSKFMIPLFLIFGFKSTIAKCTMSGMQFFPEQKEISLNSMFIIQGYAFSQKTIDSFKERTIFLESEKGERIELNLQELLKGQKQLTQAIFCPAEILKPNTTYYLGYIDPTEVESHELLQYDPNTKKTEPIHWKTTSKKVQETLNSDLEVVFEKTEFVMYGCGPAADATFRIKNKPKSEIWFETEVVEIETNKKTVFYIKEWNDKLTVGHGMCSGAFTFTPKSTYKVRFTPMNTDGKALKTTDWKVFKSPYMNSKGLFGN